MESVRREKLIKLNILIAGGVKGKLQVLTEE